jgi:hypothetical protein
MNQHPMPQQKEREGLDGQSHDFVLRIVEDGTRNKYGKARTSCVVVNPNVADVDDGPPREGDKSPDGVRISANEALFLRCILQCQCDFGTKPPRNWHCRDRSAPSSIMITSSE